MAGWNNFKLTIALIGFSVLVAVMTRFGEDQLALVKVLISDPRVPGLFGSILHGEVWRLLTPMFVHFGVSHLVFNMFWLWDLGRQMEVREGLAKYALLIVIFAVGSNLPQYILAGPYFGGMSGVVYGLIGYFWARGKFQPQSGYALGQQNLVIALAWFALCWTGMLGNVANWAHTGGLVLGLMCGFIDARGGYVRRRKVR